MMDTKDSLVKCGIHSSFEEEASDKSANIGLVNVVKILTWAFRDVYEDRVDKSTTHEGAESVPDFGGALIPVEKEEIPVWIESA